MTRPRLNDAEKKANRLTVRFRPDEMAELEAQSEITGMSLSGLIRRRALQRRIVPATDLKAISELRRIGGLIKLVHNETNGLYRQKTSALLDELHVAIVRLSRKERDA